MTGQVWIATHTITRVVWLLRLGRENHLVFTRYRRTHPHFIRNLIIDLVLSLAIGLAGFQFVSSKILVTNPLHTKAMTADKFIALVKKHKDPVYWLGPVPGNKYSFNHNADGVDIVSYLPKGSSLSEVNQRKMTVKTYRNLAAYTTHIHPLVGAETIKVVTAKDNTVEFSRAIMDLETVTLAGRPEIVVIRYPTMQTEEMLIRSADNLKLFR